LLFDVLLSGLGINPARVGKKTSRGSPEWAVLKAVRECARLRPL
jgi:hypothetical protein